MTKPLPRIPQSARSCQRGIRQNPYNKCAYYSTEVVQLHQSEELDEDQAQESLRTVDYFNPSPYFEEL